MSSKEWIEQLKAVDGNDKAEVAEKPASKILDWFGDVQVALSSGTGGLKYATANGINASWTMRELEPVGEEWLRHRLGQLGL